MGSKGEKKTEEELWKMLEEADSPKKTRKEKKRTEEELNTLTPTQPRFFYIRFILDLCCFQLCSIFESIYCPIVVSSRREACTG